MLELLAINIIISILIVPVLAPLLGFNSRLAVPANDSTYKRLKKHKLHLEQTEPMRQNVAEDELLFIEQSAWLAECHRRKTARNDAEYDQKPATVCGMPAANDPYMNNAAKSDEWQEFKLPLAG